MNSFLKKRNPGAKFDMEDGALLSMNPPQTLFGFTYHAHMVPPIKPVKTLILGYGEGTVAELCKKIWGELEITGIDKKTGDDALNFIHETQMIYDYICIDLWNGPKVCEFIYREEFAKKMIELCGGLLCMNVPLVDSEDRALIYHDAGFRYLRHDVIESNAVIWWSCK